MIDTRQLADDMFSAISAGQLKPCVNALLQGDLTLAYGIQQALFERYQADDIAGYKAGATSEIAQQRLGLEAPAAGFLLTGGRYNSGDEIALADFKAPLLEVEFGYILATDVTDPVSADDVMSRIGATHLMFELANPAYEQPAFVAADLIAGNVAGAAHVLGPAVSVQDPDGIMLSLEVNGEEVMQGKGSDAMGGQKLALSWLLNQCLALGYPLNCGQLLMTGALGRPVPIKAGQYKASFSGLGHVEAVFA